MTDEYYNRAHLAAFSTIGEGSRALADKFFSYYGAVFQAGALTVREKSLIALSVAHVVQCPYCIDAYTSGSLEAGADLEQMTEAVHVGVVARGGAVMSFGMQMLGLASKTDMSLPQVTPVTDAYFSRQHEADRGRMAEEKPELAKQFFDYEKQTLSDGALAADEKHVIALAVAHTVQNPYGIERHTRACLDAGRSLEQLTEAVHVATAIRGGASLVHGIQMLEQTQRVAM